MLAGPPDPSAVAVPQAVVSLAAGRPVRPVWSNELGGVTFRVGDGDGSSYVKWSPAAAPVDLGAEAARMSWAAPFTPVPRPVRIGVDADGSWLLTDALPGDNAVAPRWVADPATAVRAIGEGLRAMHDALPVDACPFTWSVEDRLAAGVQQGADARRAADLDDAAPPIDRLVVCHGDACAPNTLLADDGRWSGHVDLGALGVADRWADIAVATYSTGWNYGPGWEGALLDAYGVDPDPDRTAYYRRLWDFCP